MERIVARRLLARPRILQAAVSIPARQRLPTTPIRFTSTLPTVFSTDFWKGLVPKPLRRSESSTQNPKAKQKSKEWNPATFYVVMFVLIGSMAINQIAIKNEYTTFSQRADTKIRTLREVVERLRAGENVNVEKLLGTGDPSSEQEWEALLRDLQKDTTWREYKQKEGRTAAELKAQQSKSAPNPETPAPDATTKMAAVTRGDFY